MENYGYSSYTSGDSTSPRASLDSTSLDEQPAPNYKVKFMVSYNGKIHPRPHDNALSYIGGETKIITVDRYVKFQTLILKLTALLEKGDNVCFKYQLPGEDLDALITVTNDEDLEHMMLEYDRLCRGAAGSVRSARLRLFLFRIGNSVSKEQTGNPDYLFGFDKAERKDGSDCGSDAVASPTEIQRQMNELQRMQISGQLVRKVGDDGNVNYGTENVETSLPLPMPMPTPLAPAPIAVPMPVGMHPIGTGSQPVYLIPAGAGPVPGMRAVSGHPGQAYYGMQGVYGQQQGVYGQQQAVYGQQKVAVGYGDGTMQVGYDASGRQVYYTVRQMYQTGAGAVGAAEGKAVNQDGKV